MARQEGECARSARRLWAGETSETMLVSTAVVPILCRHPERSAASKDPWKLPKVRAGSLDRWGSGTLSLASSVFRRAIPASIVGSSVDVFGRPAMMIDSHFGRAAEIICSRENCQPARLSRLMCEKQVALIAKVRCDSDKQGATLLAINLG